MVSLRNRTLPSPRATSPTPQKSSTKSKPLAVPELIARKQDGIGLSRDEVDDLIAGFMSGAVADYQMSAFAMAVFFRGMSFDETVAMTLAMRDSGEVLSLDDIEAPKVDKHSTGGVGDKVSICLAPIVAACGVAVPMMSARMVDAGQPPRRLRRASWSSVSPGRRVSTIFWQIARQGAARFSLKSNNQIVYRSSAYISRRAAC